MGQAMGALSSQIDVIKRLLRYTRRQYTLKRKAVIEARDKKQNLVVGQLTGEMNAYAEMVAFYEKLLVEFESAMTNVIAELNEVRNTISEETEDE